MKRLTRLHQKIRDWYAAHGRTQLPWRLTSDSYAIYISEVMLQQTQVQTVLSRYYFPFLERFPTLQALASAPLQDVLKAWEGLGYYSRARNLHRAAQLSAPSLPGTVEGLMHLPGIGRNTAHAIAAFAHHQPVAVMEANVKRVLHRLFARTEMSDRELWEAATALLDPQDPYTYNQAMMDIGATICTPAAPACGRCPLNEQCEGKENPLAYPAKRLRKSVPTRHKRMVVFEREGRFFMTARTEKLLGGLYGFPQYEAEGSIVFENQVIEISSRILKNGEAVIPAKGGIPSHPLAKTPLVCALTYLGTVEHVYSHFRLRGEVYHVVWKEEMLEPAEWHTLVDIAGLPLARVDQKIVELLDQPQMRVLQIAHN